jgi:hypothetical protein
MSQQKLSAAQSNKAFFGLLQNGQTKEAQDMVTDFTRIRIRESSVFEKVMPSVKIADDELTPQLGTDKNVKLVEREPNSPAAITIPLGTQPIQYYFRGDRYPVFFDRIVTPKFTKDVSELRTYGMDIRQVISDNAILDMDFEFDRKMIAAAQSIVGTEGSTVPETGVIQNRKIVDPLGITRNSLFEMRKILPSTFAHLEGVTILVNNITIHDIAKFGRDEVGGELSESMFVEGFQQKRLLGMNWIVTNKTELVENDTFWIFASPEFIGKSFVLEDVTLYLDKKAYNLEFFAYTERGATIGNPAAIAKARIATA